MATTVITPTDVSLNTAAVITQGAGTAINDADTMSFAYPRHGKLLILIDSDHADTEATFAAGDKINSVMGTLAIAVASGVQSMVILESDRFKDNDGNITCTWATNSAGFVRAFYLP